MKTRTVLSLLLLVLLSSWGLPPITQEVAGPVAAAPLAPQGIGAVWANEGGDKVWQSELRASAAPAAVINSVWDGTTVMLFGARNEVIGFNLVLEAPATAAEGVSVSLTSLTGPGGATISTVPAADDDLFNYVGRDIELFYVRYLEIMGLSRLGYENYYDERHVPERCRRPFTGEGSAVPGTGWTDRPCHNQMQPEILVPLELETPFSITAGTNQSIWGDIYIPKTAPAGLYTGDIVISENGAPDRHLPITLQVRNFALPDLPSARTMVAYEWGDINKAYSGNAWPNPGTPEFEQAQRVLDRHFQMAHRHKFSLVGGYESPAEVEAYDMPRLTGSLFTPAQGYDGPGVGVGNNIYVIGLYGGWPWREGTEQDMRTNTDMWVNWFNTQAFTTPTEYFLYLIDESSDYPQTEQWAQWIENNPGPGHELMSMATLPLPAAPANVPSLDIPATIPVFGIPEVWQAAADQYTGTPGKRLYFYGGYRPATGISATDEDGVGMRSMPWIQYKKQADRWFLWMSTYYTNFQCYGYSDPRAQTNVFRQTWTFGCYSSDDDVQGQTGWNYTNGDGVLFYPGTDTRYPDDSYGVMGPFASLRLKLWRRGLQDVDYLTLAAAVNPTRTAEIVEEIIPVVAWDVGVEDPGDPTWVRSDISWSTDPGVWEAAREELADIIEGNHAVTDVALQGAPGDREIRLTWQVSGELPAETTWQIGYESSGTAYLPVTGIISPTRAYTLPDLTNDIWYTVTLNAVVEAAPILTDTVSVMPHAAIFHRIYLPLVLRAP
ncbi:MAG: DUF4091 domain-containing protein [Anaerolineae bacterium]|nr:DUF4091 domain-containing protein [Anaerolineae bacterium]